MSELGRVTVLVSKMCVYAGRKCLTPMREGGHVQTLVLEKMRNEAEGRMAKSVSWDCRDCGVDKIIQGTRM